MEPFANGVMVLIAGAVVTGVLVGAIGGAIVWRLRGNLLLGGFLTLCALVLVLVIDELDNFAWLSSKLTWALPSMIFTFLLASIVARSMAEHLGLRPLWIAVAAFLTSLALGLVFLRIFRFSLLAPVLASLALAAYLIVRSWRHRRTGRGAFQGS